MPGGALIERRNWLLNHEPRVLGDKLQRRLTRIVPGPVRTCARPPNDVFHYPVRRHNPRADADHLSIDPQLGQNVIL